MKMGRCAALRRGWMRFAPLRAPASRRLALGFVLAGVIAGCGAVATSVALSAGPELLAIAMRPYTFRSEFADAGALLKARDWLGLSTLARQRLVRQPERGEWWQVA